MSRPNGLEAHRRRNEFAELIATDMLAGGLDQAARNVTRHAKSVRLDPWRALRLSYEPEFVALVMKLVLGEEA